MRLAEIPTNNIFIAYTSASLDVYGLIIDVSSYIIKSSFLINRQTEGSQYITDIAVLLDSKYFVGFYGRYKSGEDYDCVAKLYIFIPVLATNT